MRFTMKRDGRTLDHATLETIRKMAVQRVREGERPSDVIASFGMHRCTIYGWLKAARGRGKGLKVLASKPATGRPRTLTALQERQVFRWINGKNPMQYGFDFGLWTRQIARDLIAQRFAVRLSLASVGALLARVGLTPQKPLQRAYQRDPEAIARWQRESYPAIVRQAKRDKADIYFWDKFGLSRRCGTGHDVGRQRANAGGVGAGSTPSISAASAVSAKGAFWFATYAGGLNGALFVSLLRRMMRGRRRPLHLIVDGLPAHRTRVVRDYVGRTRRQADIAFPARLCPGPQSRRACLEPRQTHRQRTPAIAQRRTPGTSGGGPARRYRQATQLGPVILQTSKCCLYC